VNETRDALHRIATHVLARARFDATGRFGLRATPGGFGTPMFGEDVLRVAGGALVREHGGAASAMPLDGATLADLAAFAGVDLTTPFDAGEATPAVGDPHAPLRVDPDEVARLGEWFDFGWRVIDAVAAAGPDAKAVQLWPEHFDAGTSVAISEGERCNLGASPGDAFSDDPYLYVGPWSDQRPGDASYWNAPFGAAVSRDDVFAAPDRFETGVAFLRRGLDLLRG